MTTAASCSERRPAGLMRYLIRSNRVPMLFILTLGLLCLPLQFALSAFRPGEAGQRFAETYASDGAGVYTSFSLAAMYLLWIGTAFIVGVVQTSYMQNRRAVDLYHSLPLTRSRMMMAHFGAAYVTTAAPLSVSYAVTFGLALLRSGMAPTQTPFSPVEALLDLGGWLVMVFVILTVVMLVATQVGSNFDTAIFSALFLCAGPVFAVMHRLLSEVLLYGYAGGSGEYLLMLLISPLSLMLGRRLYYDRETDISCYLLGTHHGAVWCNLALALWLVLGVLLLWLALRQYERRPSERAESTAKGGMASVLFRSLSTLGGGVLIGYLFCYAVGSSAGTGIWWGFVLSALCAALLIYTGVCALLNRGFHGLGRYWKCGLLSLCLTAAYTILMSTGGLGYESFIPKDATAVSISYSGRFSYVSQFAMDTENSYIETDTGRRSYYYSNRTDFRLTSEASLDTVEWLHAAALAERDRIDPGQTAHVSFTLTYETPLGKVTRQYSVPLRGDVEAAIDGLNDQPEYRALTDPLESSTAADYSRLVVGDRWGLGNTELTDEKEIAVLLEAMRADVAAESNEAYRTTMDDVVAYIYFDTSGEISQYVPLEKDFWQSYFIPVKSTYANTIAALDGMGLGDLTGSRPAAVAKAVVNMYDWTGIFAQSGSEMLSWYNPANEYTDDYFKNDSTAVVTDPGSLARLLPLCRRAYRDGEARMYYDGQQSYVYIALMDADGNVGLTVTADAAAVRQLGLTELQTVFDAIDAYPTPARNTVEASTVAQAAAKRNLSDSGLSSAFYSLIPGVAVQ